MDEPTWSKPCPRCTNTVQRWPGQGDVSCAECGALFNAFGQQLRDDALMNPSMRYDDISDLDGYEMLHAGYQ